MIRFFITKNHLLVAPFPDAILEVFEWHRIASGIAREGHLAPGHARSGPLWNLNPMEEPEGRAV
jgi:hypothetical protein